MLVGRCHTRVVRWDRFFEDLEDQLASEGEAERAALDTEAERLRLSRIALRDRLRGLDGGGGGASGGAMASAPSIEFLDGTVLAGWVTGVGADWIGVTGAEARASVVLVPVRAIAAISIAESDVVRSARASAPVVRGLAERMTLGFVLRDLARRRVPVTAHLLGGRMMSGTIDRAGADHLDLALHDPGGARRSSDVTGFRIIPFAAIARVNLDAAVPLT